MWPWRRFLVPPSPEKRPSLGSTTTASYESVVISPVVLRGIQVESPVLWEVPDWMLLTEYRKSKVCQCGVPLGRDVILRDETDVGVSGLYVRVQDTESRPTRNQDNVELEFHYVVTGPKCESWWNFQTRQWWYSVSIFIYRHICWKPIVHQSIRPFYQDDVIYIVLI